MKVQLSQQSIITAVTVLLSVVSSLTVTVLVNQRLISKHQAKQQEQIEAAKNEPGALLRDRLNTGLFVEDVDQNIEK